MILFFMSSVAELETEIHTLTLSLLMGLLTLEFRLWDPYGIHKLFKHMFI